MKLCLLSRNRFNYANKRFREESKKRGLRLIIGDPAEFDLILSRQSPLIYHGGKKLDDVSMVIPRLGASITNYGLAVLSQFEMMSVPLLNSVQAISLTKNKLSCIQALSREDIDIPRTAIVRQPSELKNAVEAVGGFPIVLKLLSGTQGIGVMLVESQVTMEATIDTLWSLGQDILLQECVKESLGRDIRVFVMNGQVIAAIRRQARIGDFRANVHRGGLTTNIEIGSEVADLAVKVAKLVGLDVAGVDILESNSGPKVIEVNSSPGIEGIEGTTGINLAGHILDLILQRFKEEET